MKLLKFVYTLLKGSPTNISNKFLNFSKFGKAN